MIMTESIIDTETLPCVVCGEEVEVRTGEDWSDQPPLCMAHFFTEDVTGEWEQEDDDE